VVERSSNLGITRIRRQLSSWKRRTAFVIKTAKPTKDAVPSAYAVWLSPNEGDYNFHAYRSGSYGFVLSDLLRDQKRPFRFLDIGANQGLFSLIAASNTACDHVFAFEPIQKTAKILRRNLDLNKVQNVDVIEKAISKQSGQAIMNTKDGHSGVATLREPEKQFDQQVKVGVISALELNAIVSAEGPPIIIKIDVEGHELVVLDQLFQTDFAKDISMIFYECDTAWFDPAAARRMLETQGFNSFQEFGSKRHFDVLATR